MPGLSDPSWPGLTRPSPQARPRVMAGTCPAMTRGRASLQQSRAPADTTALADTASPAPATSLLSNLALALRLARRELRGGVRGLTTVLLCLALGVGVIAAVGSLRAAVDAGLAANGRRILGGDVEVDSGNTPLPDDLRQWLRDQGATISDVTMMRSLLVAPSGERTLIELKAVDARVAARRCGSDIPAATDRRRVGEARRPLRPARRSPGARSSGPETRRSCPPRNRDAACRRRADRRAGPCRHAIHLRTARADLAGRAGGDRTDRAGHHGALRDPCDPAAVASRRPSRPSCARSSPTRAGEFAIRPRPRRR